MSKKYIANTIDEKHKEMLDLFYHDETVILPELINEIEILKLESKKILSSRKIEEYMNIRDKIISKKKEVNRIKCNKTKYLLENSKYIFNYFEEKKDISEGGGKINVNVLNNFFKIKVNHNEFADITCKKYSESKNIYRNYWKNVNNEISNHCVHHTDVCQSCHRGELIPHDEEGILICNNRKCGIFIAYIVDSSKPSNKEPPNEVSYTAYIRLNHFKEILSQFQAKETTQIPSEVIESIRSRIIKERIKDTTTLNYDKMRDILRKLGLNKYFEHIQYINSLFGIKPPIMNEELHETLCVLFIEIQKPWAIHCPLNRTNFFNYTYTLYQLCVLLDQTQYLPFILLMKDLEKQREQDQIWKKVCGSLNWLYVPSI